MYYKSYEFIDFLKIIPLNSNRSRLRYRFSKVSKTEFRNVGFVFCETVRMLRKFVNSSRFVFSNSTPSALLPRLRIGFSDTPTPPPFRCIQRCAYSFVPLDFSNAGVTFLIAFFSCTRSQLLEIPLCAPLSTATGYRDIKRPHLWDRALDYYLFVWRSRFCILPFSLG